MLQFTDYGTEGRKKNNAFRANRYYGENLYGKDLECYLSKKEKILEIQRQNQHHKVKREKPKISDDRLVPVTPRLALNRTRHFWRMNQPEEKKK